MSQVDEQILRASEVIDRSRANSRGASSRSRKRREAEVLRRVGRIAAVDAAIVVAAVVIGWFVPLGMFGALAVMALLIAATLLLAATPAGAPVEPEKLGGVPLRALPLQTEAWLDRQRAALPAPAQALVDAIGARLDVLAPQLAELDEREPAADEVRKLVGVQLPELVKGYGRVPAPLRNAARNGRTPDQQLVDGLRTIETEIGEMSAKLAQGDLDHLTTRERFLQIKYRDDDGLAS